MSLKQSLDEFSNVDEVHGVTDEDLSNFHAFITKKEQEKIGFVDGAFKVIVDPSIRAGSLPDLLNRLKGSMKEVFRQELRFTTSGIYIFAKRLTSKCDRVSFINEASTVSSYNMDTCCSSKLQNEGLDGLLNHFFEDIVRCQAVPIRKTAAAPDQKSNLIKKGVLLREKFDDILKGESNFNLKRRCVTMCSCTECETDKECSDEDSDDLNPSKPEGIFYAAGINLKKNDGPIFITRTLSLSSLKNILCLCNIQYDGVTSPNMYIGRKHAFFPLHIEDMALWSINYHHFGHVKIWFIIPPDALLLLMFHLQHSGILIGNSSCWNCLGHKTIFPSVQWLRDRRIPFKTIVQKPGEAVILYPNAAHFGFSVGYNIGEAVNFATVSWLPEGINAPKCQCLSGQVHMDLSELVAAFRPDLLGKYLNKELILTQSMHARALFLHKSLEVHNFDTGSPKNDNLCQKTKDVAFQTKSNGNKHLHTLKCPVQMCFHNFPISGRSRMIKHVISKHKPLVLKYNLMERIDKLYQRADK